MKPAPCWCRVRISLFLVDRDRLSRKSRFSSPGTPKTYSTPSSSRHAINRSEALVIGSSFEMALEKYRPGFFARPAFAGSDDAVGQHGVGHFLEAGDIGAAHIVDMAVLFLAIFQA